MSAAEKTKNNKTVLFVFLLLLALLVVTGFATGHLYRLLQGLAEVLSLLLDAL